MAVSKQPSITPETSSGEGLDEEPSSSRSETKWKRFHPFRMVRKIFRRRVKRQGTGEETSKKSWSTSELQSVQDTPRKYEVPSPPYKIGLSVSHDSIFSPENSNLVGPDELNRPQGSSLSVQHAEMKNMFKDELFSRVRARRDSDDDEEDAGLPHSPSTSPTTVDVLIQGLKAKSMKSGSLSVGSLISMGSSENDEDSAVASSSGNSSRMSLLDRRSLDFEGDAECHQPVPLNHEAAHHKIAVRPKRTHGLPQKRLKQKIAASRVSTLPTTPEVTEDGFKAYMKSESSAALASFISAALAESSTHETVSEEVCIMQPVSTTSNIVQSTVIENSSSSSRFSIDTSLIESINNKVLTSSDSQSPQNDIVYSGDSGLLFEEPMYSIKEIPKDSFQNFPNCNSSEELTKTTMSDNDSKGTLNASEQLQLRVSTLIKHIEHFDSVSKHIQNSKPPKPAKCDINNDSSGELNVDSVAQDHETQSSESFMATTDKATFDSSFAKTEISAQNDHHPVMNEKLLEMEIRQQFQQQKATKSQDSNHCVLNRLYPEEESIMNDKYVMSNAQKKDDTRVVVSHQLTDAAQNLVTVDRSYSSNIQTSGREEPFSKLTSKESISPGYDQSSKSFDGNISSVVINSLAANMYKQKICEDRVTISINSSSGKVRKLSGERSTDNAEKQSDQRNRKKQLPDVCQQTPVSKIKDDVTKPPLKEKGKSASKNKDPSRRVSVEIVPFNQRVKDGKYPLIYQSKDSSNEPTKGSHTTPAVERNLSDRKVNSKNKEADKSNNRHSFSGALPAELEISIDKAQTLKASDKVHYPVQIRIHKSKTYEKENHFDKAKVKKDIKKSTSPDRLLDLKSLIKTPIEAKPMNETQTKWEVKVQSTPMTKREAFVPVQHEDEPTHSTKPLQMQPNELDLSVSQNGQEKVSPSNSFTESSLTRNRDSGRKSSRETSSSDDPEPELLRVFARRSIKQKHCDKGKTEEKKDAAKIVAVEGDKVEAEDQSKSIINNSLNVSNHKEPEVSVSSLKSQDIVKKKSKSFCEKEKQGPHIITPLKDSSIHRRPSLKAVSPEVDNFHRRQRVSSEPDVIPILPPSADITASRMQQSNYESATLSCRRENLRGSVLSTSPSSTISNGSSIGIDSLKEKENADILGRDGSAPSWLQLAQQRRELREQRERLLIGSSTNSFLDANGKPTRSSKVWDMVNNFQKLQMT